MVFVCENLVFLMVLRAAGSWVSSVECPGFIRVGSKISIGRPNKHPATTLGGFSLRKTPERERLPGWRCYEPVQRNIHLQKFYFERNT